jgi:hypothetical protein
MSNQAEGEEAAQHHDVALGEVHHLGRLVDQDETERDQPIDAACGGTIDNKLQKARCVFQRERPPNAPALLLASLLFGLCCIPYRTPLRPASTMARGRDQPGSCSAFLASTLRWISFDPP